MITDMPGLILPLMTYCLSALLLVQHASAADSPEVLMEKAQSAFDQADVVSAMTLYREAAEAGHAPAQARLAYLLDKSEENEEAVTWYRRATELGDTEGMFGLAQMYAAGEGIGQDLQEAVRWYTLAAQQGHTSSIRVLALAHETGGLGLKINYAQAISWLNAGVVAQDAWATQRLARAWRRGELGLRIDSEQAAFLENRLLRKRQETGSAQ